MNDQPPEDHSIDADIVNLIAQTADRWRAVSSNTHEAALTIPAYTLEAGKTYRIRMYFTVVPDDDLNKERADE
jgi:hypothetical protein